MSRNRIQPRPLVGGPLPVALVLVLLAAPACAGGGPGTTLVVASGDSPLSILVAREYAELRGIDEEHVLLLHDIPAGEIIPVARFRETILAPILGYLDQHGLAGTIDTIAYSVDLPFGVDFTGDMGDRSPDQVSGRIGSLTGMTYLAHRVMAGNVDYLSLSANRYYAQPLRRTPPPGPDDVARYRVAMTALQAGDHARAAEVYAELLATYTEDASSWYNFACCLALTGRPDAALDALSTAAEKGFLDAAHTRSDSDLTSLRETDRFAAIIERMEEGSSTSVRSGRAFDAAAAYGDDGPTREPGRVSASMDRYLLCTALGYAGERGNTLSEIRECLRSAAGSDGKHPEGTVYLCRNDNVRSTTREPVFATAIAALERLGRRAVVLAKGDGAQTGVLPVGMDDVVGAVIGTASFDWEKSGSRLLPGAIAEHLTSFGAAFDKSGQTKLSALIRAGAAGASGTVTEPLALAGKFPSPLIHFYYAEGASLAEAFYQSVSGPYQLFIAGDPLARPFATLAMVTLAAPATGEPWSGLVEVEARIKSLPGVPIASCELMIDGVRVARASTDEPLTLDTAAFDAGWHSLRLVAVEDSAIATRSTSPVVPVCFAGEDEITMAVATADVSASSTVQLTGVAPTGTRVQVMRGHEELLSLEPAADGKWSAELAASRVGPGLARLFARAVRTPGRSARSALVSVRVEPVALAAIAVEAEPEQPRRGRRAATPPPTIVEGWIGELVDAEGEKHPIAVGALGARGVMALAQDLGALAKSPARSMTLRGQLEVAKNGLDEIVLEAPGRLSLTVDGVEVYSGERAPGGASHRALMDLAAGWHSISLELELPEGGALPQLVARMVGESPPGEIRGASMRASLRSLRMHDAQLEALPGDAKKGAKIDPMFATVVDGKTGMGVPCPEAGLVITWKKRQRGVAALLVRPGSLGPTNAPWPTDWVVETPVSRGWKEVSDLAITLGPAVVGGNARGDQPAWMLLQVRPLTTRALRVRPADPTQGPAAGFAEVQVFVEYEE